MCQLLGKLYLPETLEEWKVKALFLIKGKLQEVRLSWLALRSSVTAATSSTFVPSLYNTQHRPLEDTVSRNAFARFETAVSKRYPDGGLSGIKVSDTPELAPIAEFLASLGIEDLDQAANENESKARPRRSR